MSQYTGKKTRAKTYLGVELKNIQRGFLLAVIILVGIYNSPHIFQPDKPPFFPERKLTVENIHIADVSHPDIAEVQLQALIVDSKVKKLKVQKQTSAIQTELMLQEKKLELLHFLEDNVRLLAQIQEENHPNTRLYKNRIQQLNSQLRLLEKDKSQ